MVLSLPEGHPDRCKALAAVYYQDREKRYRHVTGAVGLELLRALLKSSSVAIAANEVALDAAARAAVSPSSLLLIVALGQFCFYETFTRATHLHEDAFAPMFSPET